MRPLSRAPYTKSGTHPMYLFESPHGHHGSPPLLPSTDLKGANSERGASQKDGGPCSRMSMRTVPSDVRRRPLYLSVRVFPKPCSRVGAPCIAYETNVNLRGYSQCCRSTLQAGLLQMRPDRGGLLCRWENVFFAHWPATCEVPGQCGNTHILPPVR